MRWLSFLTSSLLCVGTLAAKKKADAGVDIFEGFHSKQLSGSPIKLDDASYKKLVAGTPRDYSSAILLTAMDARYACQLCREFQPEYDLLARSWTKGDKAGESRMVFSVLDFNDGRETFMSVCTTILHAQVRTSTDLSSSASKQPPFCSSSPRPPAPTLRRPATPSATTSLPGKTHCGYCTISGWKWKDGENML